MKITNETEYWLRHKYYMRKIKKLKFVLIKDTSRFFAEFEQLFKEAEEEKVFPKGSGEIYLNKLMKEFNSIAMFKLWTSEKKEKFLNALKKRVFRNKKLGG